MLTKYPNRLLLRAEIPHVKKVLEQYTTQEQLNEHFQKVLSEYPSGYFQNAHTAFVWDVIRFVFRAEDYAWHDYTEQKYHPVDRHYYNLFSAILEIEYGIPSYKA